jgi:hypothetical protein
MDIFTTQLIRVVPVPIKPASLRVKALVKDAATEKLTDDIDHFENHEQYFKKQDDEQPASSHEHKNSHDENEVVYDKEKLKTNKNTDEKDDDETHHLDLYI